MSTICCRLPPPPLECLQGARNSFELYCMRVDHSAPGIPARSDLCAWVRSSSHKTQPSSASLSSRATWFARPGPSAWPQLLRASLSPSSASPQAQRSVRHKSTLDATVDEDIADLETQDAAEVRVAADRLELMSERKSDESVGTLALYFVSFAIRCFQDSERCVEYMLYCLGIAPCEAVTAALRAPGGLSLGCNTARRV
eukprot:scaffold302940_cov31-Tisochrysis_lutea.AAC.2